MKALQEIQSAVVRVRMREGRVNFPKSVSHVDSRFEDSVVPTFSYEAGSRVSPKVVLGLALAAFLIIGFSFLFTYTGKL